MINALRILRFLLNSITTGKRSHTSSCARCSGPAPHYCPYGHIDMTDSDVWATSNTITRWDSRSEWWSMGWGGVSVNNQPAKTGLNKTCHHLSPHYELLAWSSSLLVLLGLEISNHPQLIDKLFSLISHTHTHTYTSFPQNPIDV